MITGKTEDITIGSLVTSVAAGYLGAHAGAWGEKILKGKEGSLMEAVSEAFGAVSGSFVAISTENYVDTDKAIKTTSKVLKKGWRTVKKAVRKKRAESRRRYQCGVGFSATCLSN